MSGEILYPLYRDDVFSKAKRLADYEKTKCLHKSISTMIEKIEEDVGRREIPKNSRQDVLQWYNKNNLRVLKRQKERLNGNLIKLEKVIKIDIENSKQ